MTSDRRRLLKIKLKSLATEASIIRKEEVKLRRAHSPELISIREEMHLHRVGIVRNEARCTQLAYGYIRGRRYRQMEGRTDLSDPHSWPQMDSIVTMVKKYSTLQKFDHFECKRWIELEPMAQKPPVKPKKPFAKPERAA